MNNWYVVTGAFSSGKSTLLAELAKRGYRTVPEAARELIDRELAAGRTLQELRGDEAAFQDRVLDIKLETERNLPVGEVVFLDRGVPDTTAYLRLWGFDAARSLEVSRQSRYRGVFILDPLPFEQDYARIESAEQRQAIDRLLEACYRDLGLPVKRVPVLPVPERADFILKEIV